MIILKKYFSKIFNFLLLPFWVILGTFLALAFGIFLILLIPFDYFRYKKSLYYKTEHKKYTLYSGSGLHFKIYNEILKHNLPIKFIYNPNDESLGYGWFVYNETLIILNDFGFEYDSENNVWNYCCEIVDDDETESNVLMSLDEYIETEINEINELVGETICNNAIILIDANDIENLESAKSENRFLIYDDNREEVLKNYCNGN